jgi:hypothetical protein
LKDLDLAPQPAPELVKSWAGAQVFSINAVTRTAVESIPAGSKVRVQLIAFADAGGTGSDYKVWLPLRNQDTAANLLLDGHEARSRRGNLNGSINDDDLHSAVVTFDGKAADLDWFAVTLDQPALIGRVVFAHGSTFHDGGWFDASQEKPQVQVLLEPKGAWQTVAELSIYPKTTSSDSAGLHNGQVFSCSIAPPMKACAIRVLGKPASGDNPQQAFASCAELQAYAP